MAELGECESSQDKKMQRTCTEGSVCTNDVTLLDNVNVIDIRTKVSVCMSDVTTSNIVQDKDSSHVPLESNEHGTTLAYQAKNAHSTSQSVESTLKDPEKNKEQ